jgi:cathepsin B
MLTKVLTASAIVATVSARNVATEDHTTFTDFEAIVKHVNSAKTTWTAAVPERFANTTVAHQKMALGTIMPGEEGHQHPADFRTTFLEYEAIPEAFDVRTNWPECAAISGHVRDQSNCGSCWAFGSTEAFNDRYCIKTGDATTLFSPEDTVSCCSGSKCMGSMGCNGGQPAGAWNWFTKTGVVSGGDFSDVGTGTTCQPYTLESCAHHVTPPPGMPACTELNGGNEYRTPKCTSECETNYAVSFAKDKHMASSSYGVRGVENMQKEMMEKGTVSVAFTVYEDFEAYTGGVYQHETGSALGGHAIKMIGWGVDEGTPYWICTNSWNDTWGEEGTFRILRGVNECGIEGSVVAGDA